VPESVFWPHARLPFGAGAQSARCAGVRTGADRAGTACRDCSRPVSPDRSPNPSCQSASCRVAGGVSTPGSHKSVGKPLGLYGSCRPGHQTRGIAAVQAQWAIHPASHDRVHHSREVGAGMAGAVVQPPGPHLPADLAPGLRAGERPVGVRPVRGSRAAVAGGAGSLTCPVTRPSVTCGSRRRKSRWGPGSPGRRRCW
jgi:hypothetical protein